jgi:hypothetical protein
VLLEAKSVRAESQDSGLWLWQGQAPPPRSRPEPSSRGPVILDRIVAGVRWTRRIAPAAGLILISLAASLVLRSTTLDKRISADTRAQSLQPGLTLIAPHSLIPPPSIELPDVGSVQVRIPPAAFAQMMAQPAEGQMVKRRTLRRSPPRVRRTHTAFARTSDAFWRPYSAVEGGTHTAFARTSDAFRRPYSAHVGPAVDGDSL